MRFVPVRMLIFVRSHRVVLICLLVFFVLFLVATVAFFLLGENGKEGKNKGTGERESSEKIASFEESCGIGQTTEKGTILVSGTVTKVDKKERFLEISCEGNGPLRIYVDKSTWYLTFDPSGLRLLESQNGVPGAKGLYSPETEESFFKQIASGTVIHVRIDRSFYPLTALNIVVH